VTTRRLFFALWPDEAGRSALLAAAQLARAGLPVWFYGAGAAVAAAFGAAIILLGVLR